MKRADIHPVKLLEFIESFTRTFQSYSESDIEMRELACLRVQFPFILLPIQDGDLFAGRIRHAPVGFSPQMGDGFGYYVDEKEFQKLVNDQSLTPAQKSRAAELLDFWKNENTAFKTRQAFPSALREILSDDNGDGATVAVLHRMGDSTLDYHSLVRLGIPGLRDNIIAAQNKAGDDKSMKLYAAMHLALELLRDVCLWYAEKADLMASNERDEQKISDYGRIADSMNHIAYFPPETLHHALQLFWIYALVSGNVDYGRIDVWAAEAFDMDRRENQLADPQALQMLLSLWRLMRRREDGLWAYNSRVVIGGMGRPQEEISDDLALLCIEATRQTHDVMPQLSLRFYSGQNPMLYQKALDCLADNNPYPALYNDDVNIPAVAHAFAIPDEEAVHYVPTGCGEFTIEHKCFNPPGGVLNMLQILLTTLRGVQATNRSAETTAAAADFASFDDLYLAYKKQVEAYTEALAEATYRQYQVAGKTAPFLFPSMLYDECIERGKALLSGGVKYLGGALQTIGNANTADSLLAIKKLVFEEQKLTLAQLVKILDADLDGFEQERAMLLNAPKYGNDDHDADAMLVRVNRDVFTTAAAQRLRLDMPSCLVAVINNDVNAVMARRTAASPDGRKAFTPMNNGDSPSGGMDINDVTAFLNSIVKSPVNIQAGSVQNIKFSREFFRTHRDRVEKLLESYWQNGGAQAMITVVGREELQNAVKYPHNYQNLIVGVGGYSAKFIDLDDDIRQEILNRTLY